MVVTEHEMGVLIFSASLSETLLILRRTERDITVNVHSIEQKSIGLIFRTSRSGSDVRYSCHHNSSRFSFHIFAHSWCFSVFHSLQSITPRLY